MNNHSAVPAKLFWHPLTWILFYCAVHLLIRLLFSQTLQVDDAEQIRHAQQLHLGYPIPQPPLYTWISWGLFQIFGTGLLVLTLLKYSLIATTFWLTWLVSGYLFQHLQTRYLATFAYLLMPSFAWHMHQGFTHTILLGLAIIMSLHALLRLHQQPSHINTLYLGTAIGIGLMAKYSYLLFIILLLTAALSIPTFRALFTARRVLYILIPLLLLTLPHFIWLIEHQYEVFTAIDQKLKVTNENLLLERTESLLNFTLAAISFVTPLLPLYLIVNRKSLFSPKADHHLKDRKQLLNHFYLALLIITITLALFISMPHFKVRWFHPLMMLFPLWLLATFEQRAPLSRRQLHWLAEITLSLTVLIIAVRLIQITIGPDLGKYGRLNRPIVESLQQLPSSQTKQALLITNDLFLTAHLLSHYPENSIYSRNQLYREDILLSSRSCLYLWDDDVNEPPPELPVEMPSSTVQQKVGNTTYTLTYSTIPKEVCPLLVR